MMVNTLPRLALIGSFVFAAYSENALDMVTLDGAQAEREQPQRLPVHPKIKELQK